MNDTSRRTRKRTLCSEPTNTAENTATGISVYIRGMW